MTEVANIYAIWFLVKVVSFEIIQHFLIFKEKFNFTNHYFVNNNSPLRQFTLEQIFTFENFREKNNCSIPAFRALGINIIGFIFNLYSRVWLNTVSSSQRFDIDIVYFKNI